MHLLLTLGIKYSLNNIIFLPTAMVEANDSTLYNVFKNITIH